MRLTSLVAAALAAFTLTQVAAAQRGRFRRPDEVTERVAVYFADTAAPTTDGDKVADLGTAELVRTAAAANQLTVLYLHDGAAPEQVVQQFERELFRDDALGIKLRCFHCGSIDLSKNEALKARYGKEAPLFVAFAADGKAEKEVSMSGYKANAKALEAQLDKAAKGAVKPSLETFAKKYGDLVRELEGLLRKKQQLEAEQARAGGDESKKKKADKELEELQKQQDKLSEQENKLVQPLRLPARATGARRLGGWAGFGGRDQRGNTGDGNTGRGNTGDGNTGRGNTGGR